MGSRLYSFEVRSMPRKKKRIKKAKEPLNTLDKYIIFSLSFITIYTIVHTVIFAVTGLEAKVLDALVYGLFGSEMLYCFLIKKFKLHDEVKLIFGKKKKNDMNYDDSYDESYDETYDDDAG